jgi:hypothetical protein
MVLQSGSKQSKIPVKNNQPLLTASGKQTNSHHNQTLENAVLLQKNGFFHSFELLSATGGFSFAFLLWFP